MRAPSHSELLKVWECGLAQAPAELALELLGAARPETPRESLAGLSIGQRAGELLLLRELLFGRQMAAVVACPRCAERLELTLDTAELRASSGQKPEIRHSLSVGGYDMSFHLPTSSDVNEAASQSDLARSRSMLLQRCLLSVHCSGAPVSSDQLPLEVVEAVAQRMAEADPLADIQIAMSCPTCAHSWRAAFDILSFLWGEIEAWAWRTLSDVHTLASAYGWRERDILALNPMRRQIYLEMVGA